MRKTYDTTINGIQYKVPVINSYDIDEEHLSHIRKYYEGTETWILDVGQDQLTHKAYYLSKEMEKLGLRTAFFAADKTGLSDENIKKDKLVAKKIVFNPIKNAINYIRLIRKYKPIHIELYLDVMPWDLVFFVFYAKLMKIPIISRCRGAEILNWREHRRIVRIANRYALRKSNIVLIRELYMVNYIVNYNIRPMDNVCFFHNHTPVPPRLEKTYTNELLYLNSLKEFRHPSMMIKIALELIKRQIDFKFVVVGFSGGFMTCFNTNVEEEKFLRMLKENNLESYFELHEFSNKTFEYYERASIFILPADIVFCNHSLLEAMAHQNVPIVQRVDGADLIVDDGVSGYLVNNNAKEYADRIEYLLKNKDAMKAIGNNARDRIYEEFDSSKQAQIITEYYAKKLWKI